MQLLIAKPRSDSVLPGMSSTIHNMRLLFIGNKNNSKNIISKRTNVVSSSIKEEHSTNLRSFQMNTFGEETVVLPPMTAFQHSACKTGHSPKDLSNGPESQVQQGNSNNLSVSIMVESLNCHTTSSDNDNDDETFVDDFELAETEVVVISDARRDDHKFQRMVGCLILVGIIIGVFVAVLSKSPASPLADNNKASTSEDPTTSFNNTSIVPVTAAIQNRTNSPYIDDATETPIYVLYNQTDGDNSSWIPQGKDSKQESKRNMTWYQ